jgi:hypothetical protein
MTIHVSVKWPESDFQIMLENMIAGDHSPRDDESIVMETP